MKECVEHLKINNSEFKYYLYDEEDCRLFIQDNFDKEVLNSFDTLIPKSYKSDLWRFCILYIYGGVYLDIKYKCINNFKFITLMNQERFVRDIASRNKINAYNALIIAKPKNEILLKCINNIVNNCKNKYYGDDSLDPTGPGLLRKEFNNSQINNLQLYHRVFRNNYFITFNNKDILQIYPEYRSEQKKVNLIKHYGELYNNKNIYVDEISGVFTEDIKNLINNKDVIYTDLGNNYIIASLNRKELFVIDLKNFRLNDIKSEVWGNYKNELLEIYNKEINKYIIKEINIKKEIQENKITNNTIKFAVLTVLQKT